MQRDARTSLAKEDARGIVYFTHDFARRSLQTHSFPRRVGKEFTVRDIPLFLHSLFGQWIFITGAVLTVTPFVDRLLENPWRKVEAFRLFLRRHIKDLRWIGVFCVLVACYQAWDHEYLAVDTVTNGPDGKVIAWTKYNQCDAERGSQKQLIDSYFSHCRRFESVRLLQLGQMSWPV